jgi:hypothetical protein
MTTFNSNNMYNDLINELKTTYEFDQVLFTENTKDMVFFECLKDGEIYEARYIISDQEFEFFDGERWI